MTKHEIIKHLRSIPKAYAGIMPQSTYSGTLKSIEEGTAKQSTEEAFFKRFGFVKVRDVEYEKE